MPFLGTEGKQEAKPSGGHGPTGASRQRLPLGSPASASKTASGSRPEANWDAKTLDSQVFIQVIILKIFPFHGPRSHCCCQPSSPNPVVLVTQLVLTVLWHLWIP
jgi:hypothetical protein